MIDVQNIKFGYSPARLALNGISLQSSGNKTIAIVGASGSGKSTFLRLLCGLLNGSNNNILTGSIKIDGLSPAEFTRQGKLGFMFQDPNLLPNRSVRENIAFPLMLKKVHVNGQVDGLMQSVNLSDFANYLPHELSGGMKTRVALARTFAMKPELLLLDEPFSALDIKWRAILYKELESLQQQFGSTIIIVTHDIEEALLLSNHILVFGNGGVLLKEMIIDKPLPRANIGEMVTELRSEFLMIHDLIMNN